MESTELKDMTVGALVAEDYRRADIFKRHGIDFCCGGGQTVQEACKKLDVDLAQLEIELAGVVAGAAAETDEPNKWAADRLIDHILYKHHTYVRENLPLMIEYAGKVARTHGHTNPEVVEIATLVDRLAVELEHHMMKEERILFPYIRSLLTPGKGTPPPFGSVANPIRMMEAEHDAAGDIFRQIRELSGGYSPPEHACNTYRVEYAKLKEFEDDLFRHIHLENNILFPKALALESEAFKS